MTGGWGYASTWRQLNYAVVYPTVRHDYHRLTHCRQAAQGTWNRSIRNAIEQLALNRKPGDLEQQVAEATHARLGLQ